jgi:TRAP transporter TAXI family solute receptor
MHGPERMRVSRRTALAAALGVPGSAVLSGCLRESWAQLPASQLSIATGNRGGVFHRYGEALSRVLDDRLDGPSCRTRATDASVENVELVTSGVCDLGFSLGDTASDAVRGSGIFPSPVDVVALARTYDSFVQLVVRADSPIGELADLRGKRVCLGAHGSGTEVVAKRILGQAGIPLGTLRVSAASLEASAAALRAGQLDAFFFVSGLPNDAMLELSRHVSIRLVALDSVVGAMVEAYGPEYVRGPVPASTYSLLAGVDTVSIKNYVVADRRMRDDLAYAVTRVMFEAQDEIDRIAPGVRQPTLGAAIFTSPVELHPGAVRYFRETAA